jgi:hypothetical protein
LHAAFGWLVQRLSAGLVAAALSGMIVVLPDVACLRPRLLLSELLSLSLSEELAELELELELEPEPDEEEAEGKSKIVTSYSVHVLTFNYFFY